MEYSSSKRGFANMTPERHREIASAAGKKAHALGKAHKFNSISAAAAGKIGGTKISQDRAHMSRIGSLGGRARRAQHP